MIFCSSVNTITKFTQKIPSNNYATAAERTSQQQSNLICDKREKYFALKKNVCRSFGSSVVRKNSFSSREKFSRQPTIG